MLAFTPETEAALQWFGATHRLAVEDGRVHWIRTAFPRAGGAGDQDAWLMEALDLLRALHNAMTAEEIARQRNKAALDTWREGRARREAGSHP